MCRSAYSSGAGTWAWPPSSSCFSPFGSARVTVGSTTQTPSASAAITTAAPHRNIILLIGDTPSEIPVDSDEQLVAPAPERVVLAELAQIDAVADEEGDVLPRVTPDLRREHRAVDLLVLQAAGPQLVEAAGDQTAIVDVVVGLVRQSHRRAGALDARIGRY